MIDAICGQVSRPFQGFRIGLALASALAGFMVFGLLAVGPAESATKRVPYQKSKAVNCLGFFCSFTFDNVRKSRRLHIDHVSCWIEAETKAEIKQVSLYSDDTRIDSFVPVRISGNAAKQRYAFNQQTRFFFKAGQDVSIRIENSDQQLLFASYECKVAGEIEKLK